MHQIPLNFKAPHGQKTPLEIIASWNEGINLDKVSDIKIKDGLITYVYEGAICMCENMCFEQCRERVLHAKMAEIQNEIDKTLN